MTELKGFNFGTTLTLEFKKIVNNDSNFYSTSKAEIIINVSDIDDVIKSMYSTNRSNIQKSLGKGSQWIIDSVVYPIINFSKYILLVRSNYIKLPKQLDHPQKGLINIQNFDDSQCFKWCLIKYLHYLNISIYIFTS